MKIVFSLTFYQSAQLNVDGEEEFRVSEGGMSMEFVSGTVHSDGFTTNIGNIEMLSSKNN